MSNEYYKLKIFHVTAYDTGGIVSNFVEETRKVLDVTYKTFRGAKNRAEREAKALAKKHDFDRYFRKIEWSKRNPGSGLVGDHELGDNYAKIQIMKFSIEERTVAVRRPLKGRA